MSGSLDSSFIPKRGPVTKKRRVAPRRVYLLTLMSYVAMFTSLLAAGGAYLYSDFIQRQLDEEVKALNQEIAGFSESDMKRVIEFDSRLQQASGRLNSSPSIVSLFEVLESAVVDTAVITSLKISRKDDELLFLTAEFKTDTFDSTIFQRDTFIVDDVVDVIAVKDASVRANDDDDSLTGSETKSGLVTFLVEMSVPILAVPYTARAETPVTNVQFFKATDALDVTTEPVASTTTENDTADDFSNPDTI